MTSVSCNRMWSASFPSCISYHITISFGIQICYAPWKTWSCKALSFHTNLYIYYIWPEPYFNFCNIINTGQIGCVSDIKASKKTSNYHSTLCRRLKRCEDHNYKRYIYFCHRFVYAGRGNGSSCNLDSVSWYFYCADLCHNSPSAVPNSLCDQLLCCPSFGWNSLHSGTMVPVKTSIHYSNSSHWIQMSWSWHEEHRTATSPTFFAGLFFYGWSDTIVPRWGRNIFNRIAGQC